MIGPFSLVLRYGWLLVLLCSGNVRSLPTQTFQVTAAVVAGCVISGTNTGVFGTLNFGSHSGVERGSISASYVQSTTINLACTPGTTLSMSLNGGNHYTSTRNLRRADSSDTLAYALYTSASGTTPVQVNQPVALSYGNSNNITLPLYGVLQLPGTARAGLYTDTLTVTLSW